MHIAALSSSSPVFKNRWAALALFAALPFAAHTAQAQLSYEGPTGILITPLAYVSPSPAWGAGHAFVGYHFLDGGPQLGQFSTASVTFGFAKRFEAGYTGEIHAGGNTGALDGNVVNLSSLWKNDFSIVHGKANIIPENFMGLKFVPAISVGGIYRFNDKDVFNGGADEPLSSVLYVYKNDWHLENTRNGDGYIVASKTIRQVYKKLPILLSGGVRATDAELWGIGGNASCFKTRGFGSVALVYTLPWYKITVIPAAEFSQQPKRVAYGGHDANLYDPISNPYGWDGPGHNTLTALDVPSSQAYAVRIVPLPKYKLNLDAAVTHLGDNVGSIPANNGLGVLIPVRIDAKARVAFGISYGF